MKRKIPYEAWSRECAKFSYSQKAIPSKTLVSSQDFSKHHNQMGGGGHEDD